MHSRRCLFGLVLFVCGVQLLYVGLYPAPPHSSHDAFILIPQFQKILLGFKPVDGGLGMFHPSWFNGETSAGGLRLFAELLPENNRGRHWTQLPHPVALSAWMARWFPAWLAVELVFVGYLSATLLALYGIGRHLGGERVGLLTALGAAGFPGLFGFSRYLECHLPVAALCTVVVWLLIRSEGLSRWGWCMAVSLATWSLTRTGEGAADLVGAGIVLCGPATWVAATGLRAAWGSSAQRSGRLRQWAVGLLLALVPLIWLSDLAWMQGALIQVLTAFRDPPVQYDVMGVEGGAWEALSFHAAYLILIVTDYLGVAASLLLGVAAWRVRNWPRAGKILLVLWWLVPLAAFSWMQRKASWYALATVPPLALAIGFGFARFRLGGWIVGLISVAQLVGGSFVTPDRLGSVLSAIRQPVPLESWRLRRVELWRPRAAPEVVHVANQTRALLGALEAHRPPTGELLQVGMLSRGYEYDYVVRYLLTLRRPDIEVVSVGDTRLREADFRGLDPDAIDGWFYVGESLGTWPPTEADQAWLRRDLGCAPGDAIDPFMGRVLRARWRSVSPEQTGFEFYERDDSRGQPLQEVVLCGPE